MQLDIIKKTDQIKLPENAETMKVLAMPDIVARFNGLAGEPGSMTRAQLAQLNRADYERFGKLVREANVKIEQ